MMAEIPPREHFGSEDAIFWDTFLTDEEIQVLLALPNWHNVTTAGVGYGQGEVVDQNKRMSNIAWFHPTEDTQVIWQKIVNTVANVNAKFFHFDLTGCYEPAQLTLYKSEDVAHYDWHVDYNRKAANTVPRKLSMSLLLSDLKEFEGGELQIKTDDNDVKVCEQKQGRAWFFPSYTLHRVAPVTKGVRRSLVLWVGGPPFK